ncbi:hypothetical protein GUJ93_ZPchr0013g36188 [Zizania palustris]|uniref:K Homology domain-containing protein n=1 Tax=Zizania palustris TaxID=103762 RepID=A0A8J6C2C7_ZIZPA|nr:hypothetical protein GUJ93_ZPchr0013g36188 [Zizania palustris]
MCSTANGPTDFALDYSSLLDPDPPIPSGLDCRAISPSPPPATTSGHLRPAASCFFRRILAVAANMDGPVENFTTNDLGEMLQNHYSEEQPNPYSDVAHSYNEEPINLHNVEVENPYMQQVGLYNEDPENQYSEEPSNPYQEELENSYNGEVMQQQDSLEVESDDKKWPGWPGESVFRILVPAQKVGAIIGRKGEFIKKMCEESKARIKILDGPPGVPERAVVTAV